jgi:type II secretion system protein N
MDSQSHSHGSSENANAGFKDLESFMSEPLPHAYGQVHSQREPEGNDAGRKWSKSWWTRIGAYIALGIVSFVVFLYISFPFAVLKESLVSSISSELKNAGFDVRVNIGTLRPSWFTGIVFQDVTVTNLRDVNAQLKFQEVTARVRLLPLVLGRVGASLSVHQGKGEVQAALSLPISSLISGAPRLSEGNFQFQNFAIDGFIAQGLGVLKGSSNPTMGLILPLISVTSAGGNLSGEVSLDGSELNAFERFKGKVNLNVKGMFLHIADNVWQIPRQEFSEARIQANLENGDISIAPTTQFLAPDIEVSLNGKLASSQQGLDAALNLKMSMRRRIQQNIGNLVPAVLKCLQPLRENTLEDGSKEMVLDAKLNGPFYSMTCEQS